jgi:hypothetical protein
MARVAADPARPARMESLQCSRQFLDPIECEAAGLRTSIDSQCLLRSLIESSMSRSTVSVLRLASLGFGWLVTACGGGSQPSNVEPAAPYLVWPGNAYGADVKDVANVSVRFKSDTGVMVLDGVAQAHIRVVQGAEDVVFVDGRRAGRVAGVNGTDGRSTIYALVCDGGQMMAVLKGTPLAELSCSKVEAILAASRAKASHFPLPMGASWTYARSSSSALLPTILHPISVEVTQADQDVATMRESDLDFRAESETTYIASWDGVFYTRQKYALTDEHAFESVPPAAVLPYMMSTGMTVSSTSTVSNGQVSSTMRRNVQVVGLESITVPAGTFEAFKVHTTTVQSYPNTSFSGIEYTQWYAPGVVLVRSTYFNTRAPFSVTEMVLVDYRLP